ncbi:unnamed protein product [Lactuca saligna]|uniref:Uncharacterized protein n=1 Tax=Lactuca saligna TaxID=75948 RepID=A0AA36E6W4_LACSI|nr:unnamed protein product [Lactuca saligna]
MGEGDSTKIVPLSPFIIPTILVSSLQTFDQIINQPITLFFSSQSTDPPKSLNDTKIDDGGFGGTFADIEFDPEEEDIPDHMLMSGKQFKILNKKLNYILQSQADARGMNSVSSIELDVMLKEQEARLFKKVIGFIQDFESQIREKVDINDKNNELRVKSQSLTFNEEIRDLQ